MIILSGRDADFTKRDVIKSDVSSVVAAILEDVRKNGDAAAFRYTEKFDGIKLDSFRVTEDEIAGAVARTDAALIDIFKKAAENIRAFHAKQVRNGFIMTEKPGVVMGQRVTPIASVGLYAPGGTAAYPSSVIMGATPAKIAGVERVVLFTPPSSDGKVSDVILAAANVCGINEIYKIGGAQGVAAMAFGTESVRRVDKIVGPGNVYVAEAKRLVYGIVDIDMIAGPSDVMIVADESANPDWIAADLLAQAEHDANASAILVTTSREIAQKTDERVKARLSGLARADIAEKSIEKNGRIFVVENLDEAFEIVNSAAPEHLELCLTDPFAWLPAARNAGSVFLGHYTPEALGDYLAGPNHTLPTGGTARFASPLSVDDFVKKSSYLYYSKDALELDLALARKFAQSEGLGAHADSLAARLDEWRR
ncbi:MAG: histidinol dehydrogenase [Clostridiales bacterium]|nr:histidinol dehydrogenase [Clostridiales bacterium]